MPADGRHELLDAGAGRRLERFGAVVVDRPAPQLTDPPRLGWDSWAAADGRFDKDTGWRWRQPPPDDWTIDLDEVALELRPAESGQVGIFPEHADHWRWLRERASGAAVLNLFAYTGATTIALAKAGAAVAHVDAARTAVAWARRNAARNGLRDAPIRWLTDDAAAFADRERRRGRTYGGIVLDPPTYGHGPSGRAWRMEADLPALLDACVDTLEGPGFVLLTSHTPTFGEDRLAVLLERSMGHGVEAGTMELVATSGIRLPAGAYARSSAR